MVLGRLHTLFGFVLDERHIIYLKLEEPVTNPIEILWRIFIFYVDVPLSKYEICLQRKNRQHVDDRVR